MSTLVTIVIPTFRRPESLKRLLLSILADISGRDDVKIVVADNDVGKSARETVEAIADAHKVEIHYTVAPDPGVSNARNAGMAHVSSRYVLFLDDDMEVVPPYLDTALKTSEELGTALTFMPAVAALPEGSEALAHWLVPLFSRVTSGPTRIITQTFGTGGCLVDLNGIDLPNPVFDPAMNETGGEDDLFFRQIIQQGGKVGYCADAKAWEHVPPHRATLNYLWVRHFAYGQTPSREAADRGLGGYLRTLIWMGVGVAQTVLHGAAYLILKLAGRPASIGQFSKMAEGLGKIFWWDGMSPKLYGANAR